MIEIFGSSDQNENFKIIIIFFYITRLKQLNLQMFLHSKQSGLLYLFIYLFIL